LKNKFKPNKQTLILERKKKENQNKKKQKKLWQSYTPCLDSQSVKNDARVI